MTQSADRDKKSDRADSPAEEKPAGITLDDLASAIGTLAKSVEDMHSRIDVVEQTPQARTRPATLPLAPTPNQLISEMRAGESRSRRNTIDPLDPRGIQGGFRPDDVIELTDQDKLSQLYSVQKATSGEPVLGVVLGLMYRRRKDQKRKYKVNFPGIGDDGCMEYEIKLVQAAA